jgi:FtsP/CotA-like multicopper oxidase with cupredoxin domain
MTMTCEELNAQLSDLLGQMAGTRRDISDALVEEIDDPARASMWKARAAAPRAQPAGEQAQRDDLDTRIAVGPESLFTTQTAGLPEVSRPGVARLRDGDRLDLRIGPVRKHLDADESRMLAYDGSVPGPVLHVGQGSQTTVEARNDGSVEATMHRHGLRLGNRYDGGPDETQAPIPIGGTFTSQVQFPDPGIYWYHPHIREDYGLEMGLYGTTAVEPADPSCWPPADRQLTDLEAGHATT